MHTRLASPPAVDHRLNSFDALRFVAAAMVHFGHQAPVVGFTLFTLGRGFGPPAIGLSIFFAMSGYLITNSILRGTTPTGYVKSRLLRLLPGLVVYLIFCVALGFIFAPGTIGEYLTSASTISFITTNIFPFFSEQNFSPDTRGIVLAGPVYTIKYEIACYATLALAYAFPRRLTKYFMFIIPVAALAYWNEITFEGTTGRYSLFHLDWFARFIFNRHFCCRIGAL
jgi:peptidoglycan/LPS O-acetylase OafA/YrhL